MKQSTRILLIALGVLFAVYATLSVAFVCEVYDTEADLRHDQYRNTAYLHALIKQTEERMEQLEDRPCATVPSPDRPSDPTGGNSTPPVEEVTPILYTLRTYQDLIGVFDASGQLLKVINVYCDALPLPDRTALESGISFSSIEELIRVLNAYE